MGRSSAPSFYKLLIHDFSQELCLPADYINNFNGDVPKQFILTSSTRRSWEVSVKKVDNDLFLCDDWQIFAKHHALEFGDLLVFIYNGNSKFDVKIFGSNACEKEVELSMKNNVESNSYLKEEEEGKDREISDKLHSRVMLKCYKRRRTAEAAVTDKMTRMPRTRGGSSVSKRRGKRSDSERDLKRQLVDLSRKNGNGSSGVITRATSKRCKIGVVASTSSNPPQESVEVILHSHDVVKEKYFDIDSICSSELGQSLVPDLHNWFDSRGWLPLLHPTVKGSSRLTIMFYANMDVAEDGSHFTTSINGKEYKISPDIIRRSLHIDTEIDPFSDLVHRSWPLTAEDEKCFRYDVALRYVCVDGVPCRHHFVSYYLLFLHSVLFYNVFPTKSNKNDLTDEMVKLLFCLSKFHMYISEVIYDRMVQMKDGKKKCLPFPSFIMQILSCEGIEGQFSGMVIPKFKFGGWRTSIMKGREARVEAFKHANIELTHHLDIGGGVRIPGDVYDEFFCAGPAVSSRPSSSRCRRGRYVDSTQEVTKVQLEQLVRRVGWLVEIGRSNFTMLSALCAHLNVGIEVPVFVEPPSMDGDDRTDFASLREECVTDQLSRPRVEVVVAPIAEECEEAESSSHDAGGSSDDEEAGSDDEVGFDKDDSQ